MEPYRDPAERPSSEDPPPPPPLRPWLTLSSLLLVGAAFIVPGVVSNNYWSWTAGATRGDREGAILAWGVGLAFVGIALAALDRWRGATGPTFRHANTISVVLGFVSLLWTGFWWLGARFENMGSGRPIRVQGRPRLAGVREGRAWHGHVLLEARSLDVDTLDTQSRRALAERFLADARAEHASVAAFSKISLQLIGAGAPPDLIERAHRAALDEIRHAQWCFAVASAYAGRDYTADACPAFTYRGDRPQDRDALLVELAVESFVDGCVGEAMSVTEASERAASARDPQVARGLVVLAEDEARHADLAWSIVEWTLSVEVPSVRTALAAMLATATGAAADANGIREAAVARLASILRRVDPAAESTHILLG